MVTCIFTIDYELYGNGTGSLRDHVLEPAQKLHEVFARHGAKFVNFVEALEFLQIERLGTDTAAVEVREQIRRLHQAGHETALHLHPQWANARFEHNEWQLDYSEYNLCTLGYKRIAEIVDLGIAYLRSAVGDNTYQPVSFRAGNWLFQPTRHAAEVLASRGIRIDSSVFKGGLQHAHRLDYRPSLANGHFWHFRDDVNVDTGDGPMLEMPIFVRMVPFWRMLTGKRFNLQRKSETYGARKAQSNTSARLSKLRDYCRPFYPLKFDFCRMTFGEMTAMVETTLRLDARSPNQYIPLVAIGHTKDLEEFEAIDRFLAFLREREIPVSTLREAAACCLR